MVALLDIKEMESRPLWLPCIARGTVYQNTDTDHGKLVIVIIILIIIIKKSGDLHYPWLHFHRLPQVPNCPGLDSKIFEIEYQLSLMNSLTQTVCELRLWLRQI